MLNYTLLQTTKVTIKKTGQKIFMFKFGLRNNPNPLTVVGISPYFAVLDWNIICFVSTKMAAQIFETNCGSGDIAVLCPRSIVLTTL